MSAAMEQLPQKFRQAFALHLQGQLAPAQALYEEILRTQPEHFDVLRLLAVIAAQQGNPQQAFSPPDRAPHVRAECTGL